MDINIANNIGEDIGGGIKSPAELLNSVTKQAADGLNAIKNAMGGIENMGENEANAASSVLDNVTNRAADILHAMENAPEFKNYKPEDPFEEEDKKLGISKKGSRGEATEETGDESEPKSKTQQLKEKFQQGVKSIIPGLNIDDILEKLAGKCKPLQDAMGPIKDSIYNIKENKRLSPEEKAIRIEALKKQRQNQIDAWKESQKDYVMHIINDIKADFGEIKFGVESLTVMIPIVISQINLPTFIGTGSPNPARIAADFLSYKRLLQAIAHPIQTAACKMLDNCDRIGFDLPDPVLKVVETVATLGEAIDKIPG